MTTAWIMLASVVGVVLLTSLFKNVDMSSKVKNAIATGFSVVGAVVTDLAARGWNVSEYQGVDILTAALTIYGGSQLIYNFIMNGTRLDEKLAEVPVIPTDSDGN